MFDFLRKKKYLLHITPNNWDKMVRMLLNLSENKERAWWDILAEGGENCEHDIENQEIVWEIDTSFSPDIGYKSGNRRNNSNLFFYLSYNWVAENRLAIDLSVGKKAFYITLISAGAKIAFVAYFFTRPFLLGWHTFVPYLLMGMILFAIKQVYTFIYTTNFIEKYLVKYLKLIPIEEYEKIQEIGIK